MKLPLVLLAIPSVIIGYLTIEPMLFGHFFSDAIMVDSTIHPAMTHLAQHYAEKLHSPAGMAWHGFLTLPFLLAALGVGLAWVFYTRRPDIPASMQQKFNGIYQILENKYGFDSFNERVFAGGARLIGDKLWKIGDIQLIDGAMVNGTAKLIGRIAQKVRHLQSGLIYHYAFAMIIGVFLFLTLFIKIN